MGLSVVPYVYFKEPATGPDAGKLLQPNLVSTPVADKTPSPGGGPSMSVAAIEMPIARPAVNPWLVAAAVVVPTFMEVLDTTIANVALRYIAGGLSASVVDSEWVITSYLAANATVLPISGWLSAISVGGTISCLDPYVHRGLGIVRHGHEPGRRSFCFA